MLPPVDAFAGISVSLDLSTHVGQLTLARPAKGNAIDEAMWSELGPGVRWLVEAGARAIVVSGSGKNFCAGIDLPSLMAKLDTLPSASSGGGGGGGGGGGAEDECQGRERYVFRQFVFLLQEAMSVFERCPVPAVAAIHGHCVGAGVDLATACDIRLATHDARICVKEADLGIVADMGTLQRLPAIVGHGVAADLALSARTITGAEAQALRLVSQTFESKEALAAGAAVLAASIAAKSPLAVVGTKRVLLHQRDNPGVAGGLDYVATWNAAMLPGSADLAETFRARAEGRRPLFSRL
ncbi:enoyl-hydratase [Micractinium conductrix]|uniref:Enoyl-hydratase n=1 Tax=Micractinium conductrix TaxID=554055 RepID=A0A2P6VB33_9CHLO|nr:enoyl-hydratase [Micractinium conductrix]|eukprot:PSC71310.1 enoyl-hydratase [Micractinium conductrix]